MPERAEIEAATLADAIFDELSSPGALIGGFDKATLCRAVTAALDRVRDARGDDEACPACSHEWRRHDPVDGRCDAHSAESSVFGPCRCGRDVAFTAAANARLSQGALAARSPQGEVVKVEGDAMLVPPPITDEHITEAEHSQQAIEGARGKRYASQGEDHEARLQAVIDVLRNYVQLETAEVARQVLVSLSRVSPSRDGTVAVEDVTTWLRSVDGGLQHGWAKKAADAIEREFGSARAGESNER